jgi:hypothetical protein
MELFICKESKRPDFVVSLWFVITNALERRVCYAPPASWLEYSRRMEGAHFLNDSLLGQVDACLARGSSVHLRLPLDQSILGKIPITTVRNSPRLRHVVEIS